ncbi:MAG: FAD-binding oxidoreductase [Myxococcales bacterium]|nr:FAD-binding oxidoreductase [Myxococcales bacterium]
MSTDPRRLPELPDSLWAATAPSPASCPPLSGDRFAELGVVGGGFTGLSAAYHAAEAGAEVVLVEAAEPGWGAAGRNGGQVIPGLKLDPDNLEHRFGAERGRRLVDFAGAAPDLVFELVTRHRIDCGARRQGWVHAVHGRAALRLEEDRMRQWQARGATLEMLDRNQVAAVLGTDEYIAGLFDPRGGWLQPLAYARGLARAAQSAGASLHGMSPATRIVRNADGWRIATPSGNVIAKQVLLCTNAYTDELWPRLSRSLIPVTSYQVATEPLSDELRARILPKGHVSSDTRRLLSYFCMTPEGRLVMGGRGPIRESERREVYAHIVASMHKLFPETSNARVDYFWSGRVAVTLDQLPKICELGPGLWSGGGYNGRGVAMATAIGRLLAKCAGGAAADSLPLPPSKARPLPFHGLRGLAIGLAVAWKLLLDAWEVRRR